jgi:hypothetical protein
MKLEFSRHILEKYTYIKFHENPVSGSQVFPCGLTDRRIDMKLIVGFRSFANVSKKAVVAKYLWK